MIDSDVALDIKRVQLKGRGTGRYSSSVYS